MSVADELRKLQELKEQGVLTEAEFASAKSALLGTAVANPAPPPEPPSPARVAEPTQQPPPSLPPSPAPTSTTSLPSAPKKGRLLYLYDLLWLPVVAVSLITIPLFSLIPVAVVISRKLRYRKFAISPELYRPVPQKEQLRPVGLALGVALLGAGAYIFFMYVPSHSVDPDHALFGVARALDGTLLSEEAANRLRTIAAIGGLLGIVQLVSGARTKAQRVLPCPSCRIDVVARRALIGEQCERCGSTL